MTLSANGSSSLFRCKLAKLHTYSLLGIDAQPVEVKVDVSPGALPKTPLVGLHEQAAKESTHRIERAMVNSGFVRPQDRVLINLATADDKLGSAATLLGRFSITRSQLALFTGQSQPR